MPQINRWYTRFFDRSDSHDVDYQRRLYSFLSISYFGCVALSVFSYINYINNYLIIFYTVSVTSLLFFINLILFHRYRCLALCSKVASFGMLVFCLVLVYQGGIDNTALYWALSLPLILFTMLGYLYGGFANIIFFISLLFMLNNPEYLIADYSRSEIIRFISSLFVINVISFINEYFREYSHSAMSDININKEQQANTDALTLLANRRFIDAVFFPDCKANSKDRFPMVLIMADVDHFKNFNDTYGHHMGDFILRKLARTMEECIRTEDIVARVGGEEFLLIFSRTNYDVGMKIAEKIRCAVSVMKLDHEGQELKVTMSLGVTTVNSYIEIESKLKEADSKLYQAKNAGRNCIY